MTLVSLIGFGICVGIILSIFRHGADPLSPARIFGFVWSLSIALTELKLSALQHEWNAISWILLLTPILAFLVGLFIPYVLHLDKNLVPIQTMREILKEEQVHEERLFWLICASAAVYGISYLVNYLLRGWLPIDTVGTNISRLDFNVSGVTLFLYTATFTIYFVLIYFVLVEANRRRKAILVITVLSIAISFSLLIIRYPIIMACVMCVTLLFYASNKIRLATATAFVVVVTAFFYWISSLRLSHLVSTYLHTVSKMKVPKQYAFFTEPYMYLVMNLENFARSVNRLDYHTYGYFTFEQVTAVTGLKYWVYDYFHLDRSPYIISGYNTYTAFWWFYIDFGVIGLTLIPLLIGYGIALLYYRMRIVPTIRSVTAYGVSVFVIVISYFNFPISYLWVTYNILAMYFFLKWTIVPRNVLV